MHDRRFRTAATALGLASTLARRGDTSRSVYHWVRIVQAQALAGLGDLKSCEEALDAAEGVRHLGGDCHNGGWIRFDGSRLAEERGSCYVELSQTKLAEVHLQDALSKDLSPRRRGSALTDLALAGLLRREPLQVVMYGGAALDAARLTRSGVLQHKLRRLQKKLGPHLGDTHIRNLDAEISTLPGPPLQ
jgi:hypothetical protein